MSDNKTLAKDIVTLMKDYAKKSNTKGGFQYINPNFLSGLSNLLYEYYQIEDDEIDEWITNMWSA